MSPARKREAGVREAEEVYYRSRGWVPQSEKADLERQLAEAQQQRDTARETIRQWEELVPENLGDYLAVIGRGEMLYWRLEAELTVRNIWLERGRDAEQRAEQTETQRDGYRSALRKYGKHYNYCNHEEGQRACNCGFAAAASLPAAQEPDGLREALEEAVTALHAVRDSITNEAMDDLGLAGWCEGIDHWLYDPKLRALGVADRPETGE